jgi:TPP-dependent pyruvate/acetoin dehydrogenase alpha subunit
MFDPELYRSKVEVAEWKARDPIALFVERLRGAALLDDRELNEIEVEVAAEVAEAVAFAEAGSWEPVEDLARYVYSDPPERGVGRP